jgi:putative membrane protein
MIALAHRLLTAGILTVWAVVLCFMHLSGRISSYLHPNFQPYTFACGLVLGVLAILILFSPEEAEVGSAGCEPGKPRSTIGSLVVAFILVVPLLVTLAYSKGEFSATTVLNRGFVDSFDQLAGGARVVEPSLPGEAFPPAGDSSYGLVEDMPPPEIIDLLYAAQLPEMREGIEGVDLEFIGQFMPATELNPKGDRFRLVRMMIMCCAADAQPVSVLVETAQLPDVGEMGWVKVRGKPTFPVADGQARPLIVADSVEKTDAPREVFLY